MQSKLKANKTLLGIVFLGLVALFLPITLLLLRDARNLSSNAALPGNLEAESGVLSSSVTKQSDSNASGSQYVRFDASQTVTPTNTPPSSNIGPRPAPAIPAGNNVYVIPSSIPNNGTGDTGPAIENWLKSLPSGSTAVFTTHNTEGYVHQTDTPKAVYRLSSDGIEIPTGITLWGYGVKIKHETPGTQFSHAAFWLYPQGKMDIRGFEIEGVNQSAGTTTAHPLSKQHGIAMAIAGGSSQDISAEVVDTWVHHTNSDAFFVAGWGDTDSTPSGFEIAHNLFEFTGRYGIVVNQNDSGSVWIHHNIIKDTALNLMGGEDQRTGTEKMVNALIEHNDLGTFMWHDTDGWLPHGIGWNYDWWQPLPNIAEVGPITIRDNSWIGGCADAMFQRHGSATNYISQETKTSSSDYHDIVVTNNDWSGVPANQRSEATWAAVHNTRNVTLTNNTGLGDMVNRHSTTGSTGVNVSGNK